jgi:hypothetical protein
MTRCKAVLLLLASSVLLWASPCRALPVQMLLVDVNGDGSPDKIELLSEATATTIAVHVSSSTNTRYRFEGKISPFGTVLAGDFDHDGDLDLVWLSGAGPDSVVLRGDGHGSFEFVDNTHSFASELRTLIDSERRAGLESPQSEPTAAFKVWDGSRSFLLTHHGEAARYVIGLLRTQTLNDSVRTLPQYRLSDRSPPRPIL